MCLRQYTLDGNSVLTTCKSKMFRNSPHAYHAVGRMSLNKMTFSSSKPGGTFRQFVSAEAASRQLYVIQKEFPQSSFVFLRLVVKGFHGSWACLGYVTS